MITGLLAAGLAMAHLLAARLPRIADRHRRAWLSLAAGVAVSYLFIHILPELVEYRHAVDQGIQLGFAGRHVFLLALLGMCIYYGLERLAITGRSGEELDEQRSDLRIYWIHIGSFAFYNALAGYLLVHREFETTASTVLFAGALGLHFLVNDYALEQHHVRSYQRSGRWTLAAAVVGGWALATVYEASEPALAGLFAFFAGAIIVNVLKEELPEERKSRFWPFIFGVAIYATLLLMVE